MIRPALEAICRPLDRADGEAFPRAVFGFSTSRGINAVARQARDAGRRSCQLRGRRLRLCKRCSDLISSSTVCRYGPARRRSALRGAVDGRDGTLTDRAFAGTCQDKSIPRRLYSSVKRNVFPHSYRRTSHVLGGPGRRMPSRGVLNGRARTLAAAETPFNLSSSRAGEHRDRGDVSPLAALSVQSTHPCRGNPAAWHPTDQTLPRVRAAVIELPQPRQRRSRAAASPAIIAAGGGDSPASNRSRRGPTGAAAHAVLFLLPRPYHFCNGKDTEAQPVFIAHWSLSFRSRVRAGRGRRSHCFGEDIERRIRADTALIERP